MQRPTPLRTDRIRTMERPFGWIPFCLLTSGLLAQLSLQAKLLYFFLCLVADEQGMSYYGERRLKDLLGLAEPARARDELQSHDLLAFDGKFYQLLSLPGTIRPESVPLGPQEPPVESLPQRRSGPPKQLGELLTALGWRS
jgi:hypothetical protein